MTGTPVPEQPGPAAPVELVDDSAPGGGRSTGPIGPQGWVDWLIVAWFMLIGAFAGVVAFFFLPMWIGSFPFPAGIVVAVAATALLPWPCYRLTGSLLAAAAPVLAWFMSTVVLLLVSNPLYPVPPRVILPGYEWRLYLLLGLGALAGAASLGLIWGDRLRREIAGRRPADQPG